MTLDPRPPERQDARRTIRYPKPLAARVALMVSASGSVSVGMSRAIMTRGAQQRRARDRRLEHFVRDPVDGVQRLRCCFFLKHPGVAHYATIAFRGGNTPWRPQSRFADR